MPHDTILLVEDSPTQAMRARGMLEAAGYRVLVAGDGLAGIEIARRESPDLIISDIVMPGADGFELLRQLKNEDETRLVVLLTAQTDIENKLLALARGADDYITKPFDARELVARAKGMLRLKRAQDALRARNKEMKRVNERLEGLSRLKDDFLSIASHDLRSPLTSIIAFAKILAGGAKGPLNADQQKYVGIVQSNAQYLISLIDDLLDLSKIEAGRMELNFGSVDLAALVQRSVTTLAPLAETKHLTVAAQLADDLPTLHRADADKLTQLVNNLLSNAVKFTPEGGQVTLSLDAPTPEMLRLRVADTGVGIAPDDLPKLFNKYQQLRSKGTGGEKGTGLGLTISERIVKLHGGEIRVESVVDEGTTFTVELPVAGPTDEQSSTMVE